MPTCAVNANFGTTPSSCSGDPANCSVDWSSFALSAYDNLKSLMVIGIAKDGHLVVGPYDDSQTLLACSTDICNGMFLGDGSYVYVSSPYHPYFVGCWGPANSPPIAQWCSDNSNRAQCGTSGSYLVLALVSLIASIAAVFA